MAGVFINYRRDERDLSAATIARAAREHFGADAVTLDTAMEPGTRYPDWLDTHLRDCAVLVAVIRDTWLAELRAKASARKDWVRYEIGTALKTGKPIIPVLIGAATLPKHEDLPTDLIELADQQAALVRPASLDDDLAKLNHLLEGHLAPARVAPARRDPLPAPGFSTLLRRLALWSAPALLAPLALLTVAVHTPAVPYALLGIAILSVLFGCGALTPGVVLLLVQRRLIELERRAGSRPLVESLLVPGVLAVFALIWAYVGLRQATAGFRGGWTWMPALAVPAVAAAWLARVGYRVITTDRAARSAGLPGVVRGRRGRDRPDPFVWRRAAQGLHDRLAGSPEYRWPRTKACQERVVDEYFALAEARVATMDMARRGWRPWLAAEHAPATVCCAVWAAVTLGLVLCASLARLAQGGTPVRAVAVIVGALVVIGGIGAAGIWLGHRVESARAARLATELADWQCRLGPVALLPFGQPTEPREPRPTR